MCLQDKTTHVLDSISEFTDERQYRPRQTVNVACRSSVSFLRCNMATYKLNKNIVLGKCTNCNHYDKLQIVQNKNLKVCLKEGKILLNREVEMNLRSIR